MNRWIWQTIVTMSVVLAGATCPQECAAGPLNDWLSGRTPYYQPQPWHIDRRYPRVAPVAPRVGVVGQTAACAPQPAAACPTSAASAQPAVVARPAVAVPQTPLQQTPAFQQPQVTQAPVAQAPACAPATVVQSPVASSCGCGTRAAVAPRTAFRSQWVRVPVTRYRPAVGVAQTAYGVPATQPCNGYTWQLQRVPVTTFRPFAGLWNALFGPRRPVSYFGTQVAAPCPTYATTVTPGATQAAPYYPAQPGTAQPWTTTIVPSTGLGTGAVNGVPAGAAPADQRPSLNPGGIAPNSSSSLMVPTPSPTVPDCPAPTIDRSVLRSPGQDTPPPSPLSSTATSSPNRSSPNGSGRTNNNYFNVTPLRDEEAAERRRGFDTTPRRLAPDNHSAEYPGDHSSRAWQVVPITWETTEPASRERRVARPSASPVRSPQPAAAQPAPRRNFDDGGWQSAW